MKIQEPEMPDPGILQELVNRKMPFGKYAGRPICDLPEYYLLWFKQKGFPKGRLGLLLEIMFEIRINGLADLLEPFKNK